MSTSSMASGDPSVFGLPGHYLTAGTGLSVKSGGGWQTLDIDLTKNEEFQEVKKRLESIEQRLAILLPNNDLQSRFPALQEAYDHYKLIEKLVNDQNT